MRLGIDLGTTRTVVSAVQDGKYPLASFDVDGTIREWIPGIAAEIDGAIVYGWDAAARAHEAAGVVRSIKRAVCDVAPDDAIAALPSRPTALDLYTGFVKHVAAEVRRSSLAESEPHAGELALSAAIAVPANATSRQRWLTIEACRRAGIEVLSVLNEPTAAGIEYAHRHLGVENKRSPKKYVVVYDLGGGTFDTSAISLKGRRFDLLATEGIARLGGDDFDEAILSLALARAGIDPKGLDAPTLARLADAARAGKEALTASSRNVMVDLAVALEDAEPAVVPAADVLAACEPLVERTIAMIDRLFASLPSHGIDPDDARQLGAVYVVGGGASFAGVLKSLRARLGRKVLVAPIAYAATAIGLAVAADLDAGVLVHETVTRHFGVWREGAGGREKIFDPIFGKDAAIDGEAPEKERVVRRRYRPRHTVGHLRFLECSQLDAQGGPMGELTPWREVCFPYDPSLRDRGDLDRAVAPKAALAHEEIEETYRYEPTGAITVRIANLTRGYERVYDLGRMA
jgi:molecular chaperone DnaK (HSP70)